MFLRPLLLLLTLAGCATHPDATTRAIAEAARTGTICGTETAPIFTPAGEALENWDCEDRALREISALVFNDQE
jgi:hypothetical protein